MAVPYKYTVPAASWWSIAYLVIIGSIISFIAYIYMLQKLPPEINSIYATSTLLLRCCWVVFLGNAHGSHRNWRTNNAEWFVYGQSFDQEKQAYSCWE
jgi:drug/metabolite transporter (DMT)-like permease